MWKIYIAIAVAAFTFQVPAAGQDVYPSRPIKMIVAYPAGGGADILARTLSETVGKLAGQQMVVENRPGASGMIGASACKNALPDGYTLCLLISDALTVNPYIFKKVPYDADKDLSPVASVAEVVAVFAVNGDTPVANLKDLSAYSKAQGGKVNWGTWGVGSAAHLLMAHMNNSSGAALYHVPYQGVPQIMSALMSKDIAGTMLVYGPMAQHLQSGKLKPLAVLSNTRLPQLPHVPTVNEQGLNFASSLWYGVFAPSATPRPFIEKANGIINKALADPTVLQTLNLQGFIPLPGSSQSFAARIAKDKTVWSPIAKGLNLALD